MVKLKSCLKDDVRFIGIWVMGGMSKSTLAGVIYGMVSKEFEASCIIDNVRGKDEFHYKKNLFLKFCLKKLL